MTLDWETKDTNIWRTNTWDRELPAPSIISATIIKIICVLRFPMSSSSAWSATCLAGGDGQKKSRRRAMWINIQIQYKLVHVEMIKVVCVCMRACVRKATTQLIVQYLDPCSIEHQHCELNFTLNIFFLLKKKNFHSAQQVSGNQ